MTAVDWVGSTGETLVGLVPRAAALLEAAEDLVERVHQVVDRAEGAVTRAEQTLDRAESTVTSVAGTIDRVDAVIGAAEETVKSAAKVTDGLAPSLERMQPTLETLAETTHPEEVKALVHVIDMLPEVTDAMRDDVLPLLKTLDNVGPDLRELLLVSRELYEMLGSLPGMGRIKKRVEDEQEDELGGRPDPGDTAD